MHFSALAKYFKKLEDTPSRIAMTQILSDLFKYASQEEIGQICYLLLGRVAPLYEAVEFGLADKLMIRAIAKACGVELKTVVNIFKKTGDLGETVQKVKSKKSQVKNFNLKLKVTEVFTKLQVITQTGGAGSQERKLEILSNLLQISDPLSARYLVRIPLDKLRLGFSDMTILDALSWFMKGDKSMRVLLEDAYNVRPDIGYIAREVKQSDIKNLKNVRAKVGVPILASLCQRLPNADEMIEKMGTVAVEPKFDGVRVQIHFQKSKFQNPNSNNQKKEYQDKFKVQSYSRNLENTTEMFPELDRIGKQIKATNVIIDSEAVGTDPKTGRIVPFQETTTRKRKHDIGLFSKDVPIRFYVFDIIAKDSVDLIARPLSQRRKILESVIAKGEILHLSDQIVVDSAAQIRSYHDEQLKRGLEGAVVKKWDSPYEPGRRGFSWVKFK
ncbi:hypothetical protein A2154_01915, partial [Candidatus Gottesmanbacteria bacterium RBG_16_43_7]